MTFVRECEANCLLSDFRMGKNPHRRGASADRMREIREKQGGISTGFSKNKPLSVKRASAGKKEP